MTKRQPSRGCPDPHAQLTLRRPDLSQQRPPRASREGKHRARPVSGIPHHDPGPGSPDLYALPAVATAVSALAPGCQVSVCSFHAACRLPLDELPHGREAPPVSASTRSVSSGKQKSHPRGGGSRSFWQPSAKRPVGLYALSAPNGMPRQELNVTRPARVRSRTSNACWWQRIGAMINARRETAKPAT
jgi:hypothetical protein